MPEPTTPTAKWLAWGARESRLEVEVCGSLEEALEELVEYDRPDGLASPIAVQLPNSKSVIDGEALAGLLEMTKARLRAEAAKRKAARELEARSPRWDAMLCLPSGVGPEIKAPYAFVCSASEPTAARARAIERLGYDPSGSLWVGQEDQKPPKVRV